MSTIPVPYVIERSSRGERTYEVFSRLLMDRIVSLGTSGNDVVANLIVAQLLFLQADAPAQGLHVLETRLSNKRRGDMAGRRRLIRSSVGAS
jgi:ATP-dependent Clp protease protease subunit